jgi:hypothetical protein
MVTEIVLFGSPDLNRLHFCLWGLIKRGVYKIKVDTRDELFARILDAAARIRERGGQLRRTVRDLRTRVANCI